MNVHSDNSSAYSLQLNALLHATNTLIQAFTQPISETELLQKAIATLSTLTHAQYGAITILEKQKIKHFIPHSGSHNKTAPPSLKGLLAITPPAEKPLRIDNINDAGQRNGLPQGQADIKTLLAAPIYLADKMLGHVYLCNKNMNESFSKTDEQLVSNFVASLSLVLDNLQHRSAKHQAEEQIKLHAKIFDNSAEAVIIADDRGRILSINQAFTRITGYNADEVIGKPAKMLNPTEQNRLFYNRLWSDLRRIGYWHGEIWDKRKNRDIFPAWLSVSAIRNETGKITHYIGLLSDISERKRFQEQIQYLAHYDALTELPNRSLFSERIQQLLSLSDRHKKPFAILAIDIDHFKNINDTFGHAVGDELLHQLAARLFHSIRIGDTVARLGSDEFGITLTHLHRLEDAAVAAEKILKTLEQPFILNNQEVFVTGSIGISAYPNDSDNAASLIKHAEAAMFYAKAKHRNNYQFYHTEITVNASKRIRLESNLRRALENNEFVLYYQPKVDLKNQQINSAEALIRWQHPERGLVLPDDFIPILEESGLITNVGDWVLQSACKQINTWLAEGIEPPAISLNVSARQFDQDQFIQNFEHALCEHNCPAGHLEVEITETTLMNDAHVTSENLDALHNMGLQVSIDDFGTGYSSLAYLSRFPIDTLKIDRTFIKTVTHNKQDAIITRSVVNLAHNLGLKALAEGIETQKQLDYLCSLGCDSGQGYFFCHPIPASELTRKLRQHQPQKNCSSILTA